MNTIHRALQTMRSFTSVMPGERRGCIGCHEVSVSAPPGRRAATHGADPRSGRHHPAAMGHCLSSSRQTLKNQPK